MKGAAKIAAVFIAGISLAVAAVCQPPGLAVRLFSVHPPERLSVSAGADGFHYQKCAQCKAVPGTASLTIQASGERLQVFMGSRGNDASEKAPNPSPSPRSRTTRKLGSQAHISGATGLPFQTTGPAHPAGWSASTLLIAGSYRLSVPPHGAETAASPLLGTGDLTFPLTLAAHQGHIVANLQVPVENYVRAAVAGESLPSDPNESLKAMAVVARTFAARFRPRHRLWHVDFCDSTHCQKLSFTKQSPRIQAAVEATAGEMLWHQGRPAATYYHQNCGGTVASAGEVWPGEDSGYLRQHPDPYCLRASGGWMSNIKKADLRNALSASGIRLPRDWQDVTIVSRTLSGRVQHLRLRGANGAGEELQASSLRFAVGRALGWNLIKSDLYDIRDAGDEIYLRGRGSGHGVGMCQVGATQMAKEGKDYRQILSFYYPGTRMGISAQGIGWQTLGNERLDVLTTEPNRDRSIMETASKLLTEAESRTGLRVKERPQIKIYPTVAIYRDATGEPGWVAASTRGQVIRLQPASLLRERGILEATLAHEFLHQLLEENTTTALPLWFREGLAAFLAEGNAEAPTPATRRELTKLDMASLDDQISRRGDAAAMRAAYATARREAGELVQIYGRGEVLSWLHRGIPVAVIARILNGKGGKRGSGVEGAKDISR